MPENTIIQYGCFGLLAALVVWSVYAGIPNLLATHKDTIARLITAFERETDRCREERIADRDVHVNMASMLGGKLDEVKVAVHENTRAVERIGANARLDAKPG